MRELTGSSINRKNVLLAGMRCHALDMMPLRLVSASSDNCHEWGTRLPYHILWFVDVVDDDAEAVCVDGRLTTTVMMRISDQLI